jgi:predicted O-methyltransferase YrrM
MTGGVNPGDRRALYYLVRAVRPELLLEIGTHIGSSTVALALAAKEDRSDGVGGRIVTVDVRDVNDERTKPWEQFQMTVSPFRMLSDLGLEHTVRFVASEASQYLRETENLFDLIFLDGDHDAEAVYREIPLALKRLRPDGLIVLHDYFPGGRALWPGHEPILGPWLAMERLREEGCKLNVIPFEALPWATKLGSSVSSLALVVRSGH